MGANEPVTAVFTWDVKPGREQEFEEWAHALHEAASRFPGHQGATWLRAEGLRHRYYTVLTFDTEDRLGAWLDSEERAGWMDRLDGVAAAHRHQRTSGLETWFSLPGEAVPPPPRWKMVLVTFAAVYPLSLLYQVLLAQPSQSWPLPLRALAFPIVMVPLLTFAIMSGLSRVFRRYLYPAARRHRPAVPDQSLRT